MNKRQKKIPIYFDIQSFISGTGIRHSIASHITWIQTISDNIYISIDYWDKSRGVISLLQNKLFMFSECDIDFQW